MTECILALFGAGRAALGSAGDNAGDNAGDGEMYLAEQREEQALNEEARRVVGAELVALALIALRKRGG